VHNILIDINYNYEAYNTSSASCILKVVCIFPSNGHIRLFRRLGPVGVGFHKEKSLQSSESWIIALTYPHKYPMILCIHIDRWKCRFCRVIRVILTARDENHTTSGILRYFSSQRQISISLNTNMHQIISTYLLDKNQALKHVRRSNSPVLSAKNWFSFSRKSHLENDHRFMFELYFSTSRSKLRTGVRIIRGFLWHRMLDPVCWRHILHRLLAKLLQQCNSVL